MPREPDSTPSPSLPPSLALMHAAFVLAGFGTLLLGPILPLLSARFGLADARAGLFLLAQFLGATIGGSTVTRRLECDLMIALAAAAAGLYAFAVAPTFPIALAALLVAGFGIGRTIASVNIIAGARYTHNRAAALTWLNLTWSFGALLSPLAAASLAGRYPLEWLLSGFASLFVFIAAAYAYELMRAARPATLQASATPAATTPLAAEPFLIFAALIFLYGGLETALGAWLTTFAQRELFTAIRFAQILTILLLAGLTLGRAITGLLLRILPVATLQRAGLLFATLFTATLALTHYAATLAASALLLGICLAPVFPATFAILMARRPTASQAGIALAASGIGAAGFPALMGLISTHTGTLRLALVVPILLALTMLLLTAIQSEPSPISEAPASV